MKFQNIEELKEAAEKYDVNLMYTQLLLANDDVIAGVVAGRHEIPAVNGLYIFDKIEDPMDFGWMEKQSLIWVDRHAGKKLHLFVTGLTSATLAVINACRIKNVELVCWHYSTENGKYYPQNVFTGDLTAEERHDLEEAIWPYGE